jgi:hypothetical protein
MRCLDCKYDLRKLSDHRCPECGREFDPNDPTTFEIPVKKGKVIIRLCSVGAISLVISIVCAGPLKVTSTFSGQPQSDVIRAFAINTIVNWAINFMLVHIAYTWFLNKSPAIRKSKPANR